MKICPTCGMRFIRNDYYEKHLTSHPIEVKAEEPVIEPVAEPVLPVEPVPAPPPVFQESNEEVKLNFRKPIEVYINGKPYLGKEITFKNIAVASEVVRIAREAYGRDILL